MSPRKSVTETATTRTRIIERAFALASTDGLAGITIGRLAADLGMSKAGVIGHFGTKEALQLATIDMAVESFQRRVLARVIGAHPGTERLACAYREWITYMATDEQHAGCFLSSVATEFDGRPGPIRDAVVTALSRWSDYVAAEVRAAIATGELPVDTDVDQLTFELNGIALAVQQAIQLDDESIAPARAERAIDRLLSHAKNPI